MSIHSAHSPENVGSAIGGVMGGLGQAAILAYALSKQDGDRRAAQQAACIAAASRARAGVLDRTVEDLRERLADSRADLEVAQGEIDILRRQVAELTQHRRILADALREARVAA